MSKRTFETSSSAPSQSTCLSDDPTEERRVKSRRVDEDLLRRPEREVDPVLLFARRLEGGSSAKDFRHWVILGDSYSAEIKRNWLGHLTHKSTDRRGMTLHNFAVGGDTAEDNLTKQVARLFRKYPFIEVFEAGERDKVLVVIWIGINDCARNDAEDLPPIVEVIFDAMHDLYVKWKARAFLLIDVPPMHRSPGGVDLGIDDERYTTWNEELVAQAKEFAESASQASVFVVSSYKIISDFLDDPMAYGLRDCIGDDVDSDDEEQEQDEDSDREASEEAKPEAMWEDDIHLSPAAHRAFADRLWRAL